MRYDVRLSIAAQRDFDALPPAVQQQVLKRLEGLAEDPRPSGFKPLTEKGLKGTNRVHVGRDYCIAYDIDDRSKTVEVWQIGNRRSFYEKAKRRRR